MILVDSSVWIDYFNGVQTPETDTLNSLLGKKPIGVGDLVLTEVLQGFRDNRAYETAKRLMMAFAVYELGGQDIAVKSADNFRLLRKKGVTVRKTIDVIIATFCIENNFSLLHSDRDFKPFQRHLKLQVIG